MTRSAEQFAAILVHQYKSAPAAPIVVDMAENETPIFRQAYQTTLNANRWTGCKEFQSPVSGLVRAVVFTRECREPAAKVRGRKIKWAHGDADHYATQLAVIAERQKLLARYPAPDFCVVTVYDTEKQTTFFEVWRGSDYVAKATAGLTAAEVVGLLDNARTTASERRAGGKAAGKKRAKISEEDLLQLFTAYRRRNPDHSYATAEAFIGKDYLESRKIGQRISRATGINPRGLTPAKWYKTL